MQEKKLFIKYNTSSYPNALLAEAEGLRVLEEALKENNYLFTPQLIDVNEKMLTIEKVKTHSPTQAQMQAFGKGLARLHQKVFTTYGFKEDNFIGLAEQKNIFSKNWGLFFIEQRLEVQVGFIKNKRLKEAFFFVLKKHKQKLETFLNDTCAHPSMVHGDLWSGNVLFSKEKVFLIDPALYFADREVDLAMSEMFGGFSESFYKAYDEVYARSSEYVKKRELYNLYHYLNHYNLFGEAYLSACERGFLFVEKL